MNVYLETSAVLSWLLEEPEAVVVERTLRPARGLFTSELTQAECLRALRRLGAPPDGRERDRLAAFLSRWDTVPMDSSLLMSVGKAFPVEPVRTLEAIHLVTALELRESIPDLQVASFDHRVRDNARALGFGVVP